MNTANEIKVKLYKHCVDYVAKHIAIIEHAIAEAQSAVNGETKNTAGDRYETERAMKQRETELFGKRLADGVKQQAALHEIDILKSCTSVQPGSLVATSIGHFFIAISADEVTIDGEEYSIISPESPIGQAMTNATAGKSFLFRGKPIMVTGIC